MHDGLSAARGGLFMALACNVPVVLWLLGQAWLGVEQGVALGESWRPFMPVMLVLQACVLSLCMPLVLRFHTVGEHLFYLVMLLLVPLPLYCLLWLAGVVDWQLLMLAGLFLCALAVTLYLLFGLVLVLLPLGESRSLVIRLGQLLLPMVFWHQRSVWLGAMGL